MPITIDPGNSINDNLVGWWPMDEGSGTVANDVSGLGNHGTLVGGISWGSGPGGEGATVFHYDAGEGISVPHDASLALVGDMTMCAWVKMPGFPGYHNVLQKGEGYPNPYGLVCASEGTYLTSGDGGSQDYLLSGTNFSVDTWAFLAGVRGGSDLTLYLNATANGTNGFSTAPVDSGLDLVLGNRSDFAVPFNGSISHVRIWDRALSEVELGYIYADIRFGELSPPPPTSTGARGRRLARWVISAPSIASPVGEWIRQRDDEEILFLG